MKTAFKKINGFTMAELLIVLAIVGVIGAYGFRNYSYTIDNKRLAGEINGLLGDMRYARAEALRQGQAVTVCTSSDGATCSTSSSNAPWQNGWIVFIDINNNQTVANAAYILRKQSGFTSTDTLNTGGVNSMSAITYNRGGFAQNLPTSPAPIVFSLHTSSDLSPVSECLVVYPVGMLQVVTSGNTYTTAYNSATSVTTGTCS